MRHHDYVTLYAETRARMGSRALTPEQWRAAVRSGQIATGNGLPQAEDAWEQAHRPYYLVYPSILPALVRLRLDLSTQALRPPLPVLLVRLPAVDRAEALPGVETMLVRHHAAPPNLSLWIRAALPGMPTGETAMLHGTIGLDPGYLIEQALSMSVSSAESQSLVPGDHVSLLADCLRLVCTLYLLADDPSVIEPDVLADDRAKYDQSGDGKYVAKARRRGKIGWHVGRKIEVIPHYRRPHPALYHVGPGRGETRIVFRAGTIVHRDVIERLPTGFDAPQDPA